MVLLPIFYEDAFLTLVLDENQVLVINEGYTFIYEMKTSRWWEVKPSLFDYTIDGTYFIHAMWFLDAEEKQNIRIFCSPKFIHDLYTKSSGFWMHFESRDIHVKDILDRKRCPTDDPLDMKRTTYKDDDTSRDLNNSSISNNIDSSSDSSSSVTLFPFRSHPVKPPPWPIGDPIHTKNDNHDNH